MKEILVSAGTLPEAYHQALLELWKNGEYTPCPDYNTNQKECSMTMVVEEPLGEPLISRLFIGGFKELEQYRLEMLDGILDFEIERGNWAYTYHSRMAEQIPRRRRGKRESGMSAAHPVFHQRREAALQGAFPVQRRLQGHVHECLRADHAPAASGGAAGRGTAGSG